MQVNSYTALENPIGERISGQTSFAYMPSDSSDCSAGNPMTAIRRDCAKMTAKIYSSEELFFFALCL